MAYFKAAQVRYRFLVDIRTGLLKPGDRVDSIRGLCYRYKTCIATMTKVLAQLKEEGILEVSQGRATRVRKRPGKRITLFYCTKIEIGESPFWSAFYRGICEVLDPLPEYELHLCNIGMTGEDALLNLLGEGDSGFLIAGSFGDRFRFQEQFRKLVRKQRIPHVFLFPAGSEYGESSVVRNDFMPACLEVMKAMKAQGVSNPLIVGEQDCRDRDNIKSAAFISAYETVFGKTFAENHYLQIRHIELLSTYSLVLQKLNAEDAPDGFLMLSDEFAPAVIRACYDAGKTLPLCGCDNLEIGSMTIPSLTSVELSRQEIGRKSVELLLEQIRNPRAFKPEAVSIPAQPVFRDSLKNPNHITYIRRKK